MTRTEQLQAIPYPVEQGESAEDKKQYDLVLAVAEQWPTRPTTREEQEAMLPSLPKNLQGPVKRGEIRNSMLNMYDKLGAMEAEDQPPISPESAA